MDWLVLCNILYFFVCVFERKTWQDSDFCQVNDNLDTGIIFFKCKNNTTHIASACSDQCISCTCVYAWWGQNPGILFFVKKKKSLKAEILSICVQVTTT